jgi:S-adenosylmethionine hydrolase
MSIYLFTDFGSGDLYAGQVKAVLHQYAPHAHIVDLLHEAPAFDVKASAHLLAALAGRIPPPSVTLAVVDPGVGSAREPVIALADGKWFVGPDNGLLSVVLARAQAARVFPITWRPETVSASFHGRDVFAPFAGMLANGDLDAAQLEQKAGLDVSLPGDDLAEVIYIDHYGNAFTGLRSGIVARDARVMAAGRSISYARVFSEVAKGEVFWYENSLGLVEIAANSANAAARLGLRIGHTLRVGAS